MFTDQINTTDNAADLLDRFSVSPGLITVRPPHILFGTQYIFGMYVPRPEWRTLSAVEADSMSRKGLHQEISLVRLEPTVLAALRAASGTIELSVLESPDGAMTRGVIPLALGQRVLEHLLVKISTRRIWFRRYCDRWSLPPTLMSKKTRAPCRMDRPRFIRIRTRQLGCIWILGRISAILCRTVGPFAVSST